MALQKPVTIWALLVLLLLLYHHHHAFAASGGRMGGSSFSSRSSSTRTSRSRSSSTRRYSVRTSSPDSFSSRSYSSKISCSVSPKPAYELGPYSGCTIMTFFAIAIAIAFVFYFLLNPYADEDAFKTSVVKLQVGLVGTARSLQRDLNIIAKTTDTSKQKGFRYILQETIAALLQIPDYCVSAYSSLDAMNGAKESEKRFKELSAEERSKFDESTLVNFNNIRKETATSEEYDGFPNEYIVITIIVAAKGVHELPAIKSVSKLKEALQKLSSIPSSKITAVEVLWTPQKENDILTERQVRDDYPLLHPL